MTATNGTAPTLEELRESLERDRLQLRSNLVKRQLRLTEAYFFNQPLIGGPVNPLEQFFDGNRWTYPLYPWRGDGKSPFWSETQRDYLRAYARYLVDTNAYARAAVEGLTNYTIRRGYGYNVAPVEAPSPDVAEPRAGAGLVAATQQVIDDFSEANGWPELERELFRRCRTDGEAFLRFFFADDGTTAVRVVEPEQVREPEPTPEWYGGVRVDDDDVSTPLGYWVTYTGDVAEGEEVPAEEMLHVKVNVTRNARRGVSDFLAVGEELESAKKLLRNEREGEAVRSAIAYLREHAQATPDVLQALQASELDAQQMTDPRTGRPVNTYHVEPGTVQDINAGQVAKPMPAYDTQGGVAVLAATLQAAAARWQAPVWLISADASANSYANALSAESPFTVAVESEQAFFMRAYKEVMRRVVDNAAAGGLLPAEAPERTEVQVEAPPTTPRNKAEENEINVALHNAGLLSAQTWSVREDLDFEAEQANRKEEIERGIPPPAPVPTRVSGTIAGAGYAAPSGAPGAQMAREVDDLSGPGGG